ncbi:hypothetical protein LCGC14_3166420, partial [marine sediment metagenome]
NPYDTPYDAFINYMNVLSDFTVRVNAAVPKTSVEKEIANLTGIIDEKDKTIEKYEKELYELNKQLLTGKSAGAKETAPKKTGGTTGKDTAKKKTAAKTTAGKKTVVKATAGKKKA